MIKINLVPVKEKKKRKELFIVFWIAVFFIAVALGMTWIYVKQKAVEKDLINQIAQVKEEAKKYEEKIREIKEFEANEAKLGEAKKTVKSINEIQRKIIATFDQVASSLSEGVWLKNITQGREGHENEYTISGYALSQTKLKNFLTNLQRNIKTFKEVSLKIKSIFNNTGGGNVHEFEIKLKVVDKEI